MVDNETFLIWGNKELSDINLTKYLNELADNDKTHVTAIIEGCRVEPMAEFDGEDFDMVDFSDLANTTDKIVSEVKG